MNKSTTQTANNIKFLGPAYLYNMLQVYRNSIRILDICLSSISVKISSRPTYAMLFTCILD